MPMNDYWEKGARVRHIDTEMEGTIIDSRPFCITIKFDCGAEDDCVHPMDMTPAYERIDYWAERESIECS